MILDVFVMHALATRSLRLALGLEVVLGLRLEVVLALRLEVVLQTVHCRVLLYRLAIT
jgi:hypothetical protein